PDKGRRGSAWRTLTDSLADPEFARTITRIEDACALLDDPAARAPAPAKTREEPCGPAPERPASSPARTLSLAPPPVALFQHGARRRRPRTRPGTGAPSPPAQPDLFAPPPPSPDPPAGDSSSDDTDPRVAGRAAHRVLELWPLSAWGKPTTPAAVLRKLV